MRKVYNLTISPDREFARRIKQMTGRSPRDLELYKVAFYHKSSCNDRETGAPNNERLEFLGDAILSCAVGEYLFKKYPGKSEGFLTKMRSKIVKRQTLNDIAEQMELDTLMLQFNQTQLSKSMLGNALEALLGAFYLENGYNKTQSFIVKRIIRTQLDIEHLETLDDNFKSQLLELCQKNGTKIHYKVLQKFKKQKRDRFKVAVFLDNQQIAFGEDYSKKSAEQIASQKALAELEPKSSEEE